MNPVIHQPAKTEGNSVKKADNAPQTCANDGGLFICLKIIGTFIFHLYNTNIMYRICCTSKLQGSNVNVVLKEKVSIWTEARCIINCLLLYSLLICVSDESYNRYDTSYYSPYVCMIQDVANDF